jgi:hypothetical protein
MELISQKALKVGTMVLLGRQAERYVKSVGMKISIQFKQVTGGEGKTTW